MVAERVLERGAVAIPTYRYTSDEFAERERVDLWPHVWQFACSVDHVANPGDFYEYRIGDYSVLLVRADDGVLRAFQNACRHRGSTLCEGGGSGLEEIRCPFHNWTWDLAGQLSQIPSRREFGINNDDFPLVPALVDTWGPFVFVNMDTEAEPLEQFLEEVPGDCSWARIDEFRCTALVSLAAECNWKTLIEAFSETYHVQGIHREMLPMCDDVNGPQKIWGRHGKLEQPYGLPSPRLRDRPDDQRVWEGFVEIMGNRAGLPTERDQAGPAPEMREGETIRDAIARRVREHNESLGLDFSAFSDDQVLNMQQYNLFPNITVLVFSDMISVVRARPGATVNDAYMDTYLFERRPLGDETPRQAPYEMLLGPDDEVPLGLVLGQDTLNFARAHRGLHQPGLTHMTVSTSEECRVVNLHRNLEEYLAIEPSELLPQ